MPTDDAILEVILKDFKDGMMTNVDDPDKLATGFREIKNARLDVEEGSLVKRLQATYYNETSLGANPIKSGKRYYYGTDSKELIISYDTKLKKGDDSAGTFSDIKTGLTADKRFSFITYKDMLYCFNGADNNQRYDGTNIRDMGCPVPAASLTASVGTSGNLEAGVYKYLCTYLYDGYQESNPNVTATSITLTTSVEVELTDIPISLDSAVTARKIYRTLKDGDVYYHVDTIANNTATTYTDNISETSLVTELATNHDIPPKWKMAVLHKSRLVGLRPDSCEVDITLIEGYNSCPDIYDLVNGYFKINENDGEDVLSISEISEGIVCFKRSSTYLIRTSASNDPLLWTVEKVDNYGIVAPYSIGKTPNGIIYLSLDKENQLDLRLFNGSSSQSLGFRVKDVLDSINNLYYDEVVGEYRGGRYYLSFTDNIVGLSYNHKILVLQFNDNFSKFGFTIDDAQISCFIPCFGVGDFGQMYAGKSDIGRVLRLETTSKDLVRRVKSDIDTGTFTRLVSGGTEEIPEVTLDPDEFSGLFASSLIDNLTATIDSYNTQADYIDKAGYITSAILYIDAPALYMAYWSVTLGVNGGSALRIRTGDTTAECSTASWSEWFTDNTGSDISAVTPKKYIQYQVLISSDDLPDVNTKLYRNSFVIKISAGLGSVFESFISFVLDIGKIHLGYQGQIKRIRQVTVEYESSNSTLNLFLAKNEDDYPNDPVEEIDTDDHPNIKTVILPFSYFVEYLNLKLTEQSLNALKIKSIRIKFSLLPSNVATLLRGR